MNSFLIFSIYNTTAQQLLVFLKPGELYPGWHGRLPGTSHAPIAKQDLQMPHGTKEREAIMSRAYTLLPNRETNKPTNQPTSQVSTAPIRGHECRRSEGGVSSPLISLFSYPSRWGSPALPSPCSCRRCFHPHRAVIMLLCTQSIFHPCAPNRCRRSKGLFPQPRAGLCPAE